MDEATIGTIMVLGHFSIPGSSATPRFWPPGVEYLADGFGGSTASHGSRRHGTVSGHGSRHKRIDALRPRHVRGGIGQRSQLMGIPS